MLILRNLNVISVQSWTYLYEGEMSEETIRPLKVKKKLITNYGCVCDRRIIYSSNLTVKPNFALCRGGVYF